MTTPRLAIRVDPDERKTWERKAKAEGLSLSAWVRRQCNGPPPEIHGEPVATPAKRKQASVATPADCPHPRGALVIVNAGLGLKRCGACGDTIR